MPGSRTTAGGVCTVGLSAFAYRYSAAFRDVIDTHGITQKFITPHCPWTDGKVKRLNRTLATVWACARLWTSNT